jgi:hypothetical protein
VQPALQFKPFQCQSFQAPKPLTLLQNPSLPKTDFLKGLNLDEVKPVGLSDGKVLVPRVMESGKGLSGGPVFFNYQSNNEQKSNLNQSEAIVP